MCCDRLHKDLGVMHGLLGLALTDTDGTVICLMPEAQEVRQSPTQMRGIAFLSLDELSDKASLTQSCLQPRGGSGDVSPAWIKAAIAVWEQA